MLTLVFVYPSHTGVEDNSYNLNGFELSLPPSSGHSDGDHLCPVRCGPVPRGLEVLFVFTGGSWYVPVPYNFITHRYMDDILFFQSGLTDD